MNELELTWERVASVWWLLMWRWGFCGTLIGASIGFVGAAIGSLDGHQQVVVGALSLGAMIAWGMLCTRAALRKQYRDFRIVLVPRHTYHAEDGFST